MNSAANHFLIVGAGAAGLMAARELVRAGTKVTLLEARERCGGRIYPLPATEFGYRAEGGAEFIHGEAPVTRALMREARLSFLPIDGRRRRVGGEADPELHHGDRLAQALADLTTDLPVAQFLARYFADPRYDELRHAITRMVEGYDAADPARASTFALRDEWMGRDMGEEGRIDGGYGALIDFLTAECRGYGASIVLGTTVTAIEVSGGRAIAYSSDGRRHEGDGVILTLPLPLLKTMALPQRAAAGAGIGFGNVVKILLRFTTAWWAEGEGEDLSFLFSDAAIPTWWTQYPAATPLLTGWFAGPRTAAVAPLSEGELVEQGLASLAALFGVSLARLRGELVASRAINWANDPFARGAYSYAMPETREAQSRLGASANDGLYFSGEALYRGQDMGTVEAALASGMETARAII